MIQSVMELSLWLDILEKDNLKEVSFKENIYQSWSHLYDSDIEKESRPYNGYIDIVIYTCKTVVLFIWQRLNQIFINSLLELTYIFRGMLENLTQLRVISSFPFRIPYNFKHFIPSNEIFMNIFKMEDICPVLWYILNMTLNIVYSPTPIGISLTKLLSIYHLEIRLHRWIRMYPDINEPI